MYQQAVKQIQQSAKELEKEAYQTAEEVGAEAVDITVTAAWWSFIMLILGAIAASIGGIVGMKVPKD